MNPLLPSKIGGILKRHRPHLRYPWKCQACGENVRVYSDHHTDLIIELIESEVLPNV